MSKLLPRLTTIKMPINMGNCWAMARKLHKLADVERTCCCEFVARVPMLDGVCLDCSCSVVWAYLFHATHLAGQAGMTVQEMLEACDMQPGPAPMS